MDIAFCYLLQNVAVIFGIYSNENYSYIDKVDMDELVLQTEGAIPQDLADLFRQVICSVTF